MNTKLKFAFEKETKGAVRYQEVGDDGAPPFAPVGTLYVRKSAMPGARSRQHSLSLSQANNCTACRMVVLCEDAGLRISFITNKETLAEVASARPMSYRSTTLSRFFTPEPFNNRDNSAGTNTA
jgi:hypothetical protein